MGTISISFGRRTFLFFYIHAGLTVERWLR